MTATRYRAPPADALLTVALDTLVAVHHRRSGVTHLVTSPVPEILAALADTWVTAEALMAQLSSDYDMPDADPAALVARLDELAETGLVERA